MVYTISSICPNAMFIMVFQNAQVVCVVTTWFLHCSLQLELELLISASFLWKMFFEKHEDYQVGNFDVSGTLACIGK